VCGGGVTDPVNCSSVPPNCTLVKPTKDMKKIATKLKNAARGIEQRYAEDVKRAKGFTSCQKVAADKAYSSTKALLAAARREADKRILKSVLVCGSECLTISFAGEVKKVQKSLARAARGAKAYAKKVVDCSAVVRRDPGDKGQRTDSGLDQILNDTNKIVSKCKVCKE